MPAPLTNTLIALAVILALIDEHALSIVVGFAAAVNQTLVEYTLARTNDDGLG